MSKQPKTPLTKDEIAAIETLNAANPTDRVLLGLFHRLAFPTEVLDELRQIKEQTKPREVWAANVPPGITRGQGT